MAKHATPLLDQLQSGPWPSFVTDIKEEAERRHKNEKNVKYQIPVDVCDDLLGILELSYKDGTNQDNPAHIGANIPGTVLKVQAAEPAGTRSMLMPARRVIVSPAAIAWRGMPPVVMAHHREHRRRRT